MHRQNLLKILHQYQLFYPKEQPRIARVRTLVQQHPNCFERTCLPGHITGSAWILSPDKKKCLLTHHRKLNRWLQLGGHADGQTSPQKIALREAQEESGMQDFSFPNLSSPLLNQASSLPLTQLLLPLDLDTHRIPARYNSAGQETESAHAHHDIRYLLIAAPNQTIQISEESNALAWFDLKEIPSLFSEASLLRMYHKTNAWLAQNE